MSGDLISAEHLFTPRSGRVFTAAFIDLEYLRTKLQRVLDSEDTEWRSLPKLTARLERKVEEALARHVPSKARVDVETPKGRHVVSFTTRGSSGEHYGYGFSL